MSYRELEPSAPLRPFVDRFWVRTNLGCSLPAPVRILPDGCIDVMVDMASGGHAAVIGAMTRATVFERRDPFCLVAARFRPGGAAPFLRVRAHELTDCSVECTSLGLRWLETEAVADLQDVGAAVAGLERLLLDQLRSIALPDHRIAYAIGALSGPRPPSVAEVAREIGWSRQQLGRAFRNQVGLGPKQFGRVARLQRAVDELQHRRQVSLASVAVRLGYFDEAHMDRDFRQLIGVTPRTARASASSIFPIRSLFEAR
jgi:AraC-like DNA-binding protein